MQKQAVQAQVKKELFSVSMHACMLFPVQFSRRSSISWYDHLVDPTTLRALHTNAAVVVLIVADQHANSES